MVDIEKSDIKKLMKDQKLMNELFGKILDDSGTISEITDDIADKIADELENNLDFKRKVLEAAMKNPIFKKRVINELINEIID